MAETTGVLRMNWRSGSAKKGPRDRRSGMSATVVGHKVFVLGGVNRGNVAANMYMNVIDSSKDFKWSILHSTGEVPPLRWFHSSWLRKDKIYIYAGEMFAEGGTINVSELWCFDILINSFTLVNPSGEELGSRVACTAGYIESLDLCVIFGGVRLVTERGRPRCLNMGSMHASIPKIVGNGPLSMNRHGSCVVGKTIYMMGGEDDNLNPLRMSINMLHCERFDRLRWSQPKETALSRSVPFRYSPTLTACGSRIFYLGGTSYEGHNETCYTFLIDQKRWERTEWAGMVPEQFGHVSFYANGVLYCYGGFVRDQRDAFFLRFPDRALS